MAVVCLAEILGMTPLAMFLGLQPVLQREWALSNTTSFTLGSSGSYFLVGQLAKILPWQQAVMAAALGPLAAWLMVYGAFEHLPPRHNSSAVGETRGRWGKALRSGDSMRYVVAYACHMWELFGLRAWLIPFQACTPGAS